MASYWGNIDDYITFKCNTHDPDDGHAKDADSAPSYRIYEDETAVAIMTGNLALLDAANTDGLYSERIQLSAVNGFDAGKTYTVYITATVDGVTATKSDSIQVMSIANETDIAVAVRDIDNTTPAADSLGEAVNEIPIVEGAIDLVEAMKVVLAYVAGKTDGGGTATIHFRNQADGLNRITMTVDADGNRSATSLDLG